MPIIPLLPETPFAHTASGNQNAKGMKHTDEWKDLQSIRQTGEKNSFYKKKNFLNLNKILNKVGKQFLPINSIKKLDADLKKETGTSLQTLYKNNKQGTQDEKAITK